MNMIVLSVLERGCQKASQGEEGGGAHLEVLLKAAGEEVVGRWLLSVRGRNHVATG